jgi:hypothetical protein
MDAGTLYKAIAEVCPVVSTKCEIANDRGSWSYVAGEGATTAEIAAADNVIVTIPMEPLPPLQPADFINRFTDAEYLALKQKHQADLAANDASSIRIWDIVIGKSILDMNSSDAKALKAGLIAGGILTQARADEIFGAPPSTKRRF